MKRKGWQVLPLGEVCQVNPKIGVDAPAPDTPVSFVPMATVDEQQGAIVQQEERAYREVAKGYTFFRDNDVLFAKITPCMENGKAAIAHGLTNGIGFGSTEFHVLRPSAAVLPEWIFAFIRQPSFRTIAKMNFTGTAGQQRVPTEFIKTVEIPIPPLDEQRRIVAILDEAEALRQLRARADARMAEFIPALFNQMFGDPATNPKGWKRSIVEEIASKVTDGEHATPKRISSGIKLLSARNIQNGYIDFDAGLDYIPEDEFERIKKRCHPEYGDVLMSCSGTIGRVTTVRIDEPFTMVRSVALIKPDASKIDSEYLASYLTSNYVQGVIRQAANQSSQANIFIGPIKMLPVVIPPLALQREFAALVAEARAMQAQQAHVGGRLEAGFQAVLHKAFNGKL